MTCFNPWPRGQSFYKQDVITPKAIEKADRVKALKKSDLDENEKVKIRSGGRCEIVIAGSRCRKRGAHVHHLMGGFGVRGRGASAKAENKLHLCERDHRDIHAHVLVQTAAGTWKRLK